MWYASMALVVTFGLVAKPMFLLRLSPSAVARRRRSGIATDLQNLSNLFLYLFSKVAVLYWAVGIILGANYYFDLYRHRHWMILIVLVLFGNQWLSVNRVFGRAGLKWMVVTFATIVFMSFVFSRFPVIKSSLLDNMVAKREPSTYFRVDLPQSPSEAVSSSEIYRFHYTLKIGIGYPLHTNNAEPEIFVNDFPFDSTWSKDIGQYIATRKMEYDELERDAIGLQLSIDKNVKMSVVKKLKKNLSRSNVRQIFFTFESDPFRTYLSQLLPSYCDNYFSGRVEEPIDSISMMPIFCSEAHILARPDLVIVARNKDVFANGTKMTVNQLHEVCVQFLNEGNAPRFIKMFFDDNLIFNQYVLIYNEVLRAYRDYKDEHYSSELGFTFREALKNPYNPDYNSRDKLSTKVMMSSFFELTNAEKEFMIRKVPATKGLFESND